ncbi:Uncharacterized [Syntrophomonas zehnderi OL-4]|uniref:Uncharacterized n=1 Tax=Syntrophomonas zehnderi OL-4 TaxID=690567 RepID=A0A0E4GBX6_9FIRM|nr:Uncharacterized [Syntrophomonas zehnderi OL-4]
MIIDGLDFEKQIFAQLTYFLPSLTAVIKRLLRMGGQI